MKYIIKTTKRFDKDLKRCAKRGLNMHHIQEAMLILSSTGSLLMRRDMRKIEMITIV
jgi:mRNA-degrading endonuclease YafQ of YafQ-DinJ toxin-antitoxin module